jgi:hypothetical protein
MAKLDWEIIALLNLYINIMVLVETSDVMHFVCAFSNTSNASYAIYLICTFFFSFFTVAIYKLHFFTPLELMFWNNYREGSSWSHGSWIYNYICSKCLSQLTLSSKSCSGEVYLLQHYGGMSVVFSGYSTSETDRHENTEISLKAALNTITLTP